MVPMTEYAKRRKQLMKQIGSSGIVLLPAAPESIRNNDAHHPYRQNSDFYYLTGFDEPQAVMVLMPKGPEGEFILFNRASDPSEERWDGPRAGQKGACKLFNADAAFSIHALEEKLPELLAGRKSIYYPLGQNKWFDKVLLKVLGGMRKRMRSGAQVPTDIIDISPTLHEMRLIKSPSEISLIQKAVDITGQGHISAMEVCHPGMNECELEAVLAYEFKRNGAQHMAYTPIVGAGANACVLHYIKNNKKIGNNELVLIDAGAEYQNYAADITRTFPSNGRFTPEQSAIYEIVLEAQKAAIKTIRPGAAYDAAQKKIIEVITDGLRELGILKGKTEDLIENAAHLPFYMHNSGHWLGLDVHDAGTYKIDNKPRKLAQGMVLTVEPGIYISPTKGVSKQWHNIGVRIEDDVLVTKTGSNVLSKAIPKEIDEIERIMTDLG